SVRILGTGWVMSQRNICTTPISGAAVCIPKTSQRPRLNPPNYSSMGVIVRRKDDTYCWVNDEQRLIRDGDGQPIEVIGSWSDVTRRREAELASRRSEQRFI